VSPVSTLIRWFPDRRGMATGMAIIGFGGGAMIGTPLKRYLMRCSTRLPDYLGTVDQVRSSPRAGAGSPKWPGRCAKVVVVGANDVAGMLVRGRKACTSVGTGNVGRRGNLRYTRARLLRGDAARRVFVPAAGAGVEPAGWTPPDDAHRSKRMISTRNVHINEALRTPQFYQLWIVLCFNVTAGIGVLAVRADDDVGDLRHDTAGIVDAAFAASYVFMISFVQHARPILLGEHLRLIGRRSTYSIFFALGIVDIM